MRLFATKDDHRELLLRQAWIGDAVLTLWARRWILEQNGAIDGAQSVRMTSNQFLGSVGNPDEVEAEIGRIYESDGLEPAFAWIEARLLPMFRKQESNRNRRR